MNRLIHTIAEKEAKAMLKPPGTLVADLHRALDPLGLNPLHFAAPRVSDTDLNPVTCLQVARSHDQLDDACHLPILSSFCDPEHIAHIASQFETCRAYLPCEGTLWDERMSVLAKCTDLRKALDDCMTAPPKGSRCVKARLALYGCLRDNGMDEVLHRFHACKCARESEVHPELVCQDALGNIIPRR